MEWVFLYMVFHQPRDHSELTHVVAVVSRRRTQFPHASQASACFTFPDVQLAKASHVTETRDHVGGGERGMDTRRPDSSGNR